MTDFGNYPGEFRFQLGDKEIVSKIWNLPDYPGEMTALPSLMHKYDQVSWGTVNPPVF